MLSRGVVLAILISSSALAGPIGPRWTAKIDPRDNACRWLRALPDGVVAEQGNQVVRYDGATGTTTKFAIPPPNPKYKTRMLYTVGETVIVDNADGVTLAFNGKTGSQTWQRKHKNAEVAPTIVMAGSDLLYVESVASKPAQAEIERIDPATGGPATGGPATGGPATGGPATGATKSRQTLASKHAYLGAVFATPTRAYVTFADADGSGTVVALDASGKQMWAVDEKLGGHVSGEADGDDLILIAKKRVHVFAGATGKVHTWDLPPYFNYMLAGRAVYVQQTTDVSAYDAMTGRPLWKFDVPGRPFASAQTDLIGITNGNVYLHDADLVLQVDAATGKLTAAFGIGAGEEPIVHEGGPAVTLCKGTQLIALDPAAPSAEHHLKIRGELRCKNCKKATELDIEIGSQVWKLGTGRQFEAELTARGELAVWVRDRSDGRAVATGKPIAFDHDGALDLGAIFVTLP